MPTPDQRVLGEKYRLVRQLDEGGMGSVWLAEHLSLHSPVAVKLLTRDIAESEEGVQRFLREARAAASLRSPHVVQILDYGVEHNASSAGNGSAGNARDDEGVQPYIVMELLEGESLAQRLARLQRLNPQQTALVFRHVARAVARAHDAGIVHRDLKPSNVFITSNEDEELIKLLDFGIAKAGLDALGASIASNTRTGAFLGTPYYVSPEQAEGSKSLDHRTDIWSLGVIAYECLLGRLPFFGETFGSLVLSICSRPMPVPSQAGQVPAGFDEWFAQACARDVEQRFQNVREAAASLRQLLEPGAAQAVPLPQPSPGAAVGAPPSAVEAEALPSLPARELGVTTAVVSSSATTRRRPAPARSRLIAWSGLGALALAGVVAASALSGAGGERPLAAPRTASASAPLAAAPAPLPEPRAVSPAQQPLPASPPAGSSAAAASADTTAGPHVAPVREPPAVVPVAAELPRVSSARARSAAAPVAKRKPPVKARPVTQASEPELPEPELPKSELPKSELPKPALPKTERPKPEPRRPPPEPPRAGKHGVNLGI